MAFNITRCCTFIKRAQLTLMDAIVTVYRDVLYCSAIIPMCITYSISRNQIETLRRRQGLARSLGPCCQDRQGVPRFLSVQQVPLVLGVPQSSTYREEGPGTVQPVP